MKLQAQIISGSSVDCTLMNGASNGMPVVVLMRTETTVYISNGRVIWVSSYNDTVRFTYGSTPGNPYTWSADGSAPQPAPNQDVSGFISSLCPNGGVALNSAGANRLVLQNPRVTGSLPSAGQYFGRVAMADFNGDGNADTAVLQGNGVTINLYDAKSNLISSKPIAIPNTNASILAADLNGDGKYDLAIAADPPNGPGNITVLLGKGDGTFGPPSTFAAGSFPFYIAIADFNQDGNPDLAISNYPATASATGSVAVLLGDGRGGFAAPVMYPAGKGPTTIVADDFTGDGIPDIVVLDSGLDANPVWTLAGKGDGTFKAAVSTPTPTSSGNLSYADFDHDGNLDILIADQHSSTMELMLGKGDGTFQAPQSFTSSAQAVSLGLFPLQDGSTVIMAPDNITNETMLYFAGPSGVIGAPAVQTVGKKPVAIAAGDINGDGKSDLVIADKGTNNLYVEISKGASGFASPQSFSLPAAPAAVALSDMNHDGNADAIVATSSGLAVLKGNSSGGFSSPQVFGSGQNFVALAVADFNGDGKPDVAAVAAGGTAQVFAGNGDATFGSPNQISLPAGFVPMSIVSADVNRDGKPDLVIGLGSSDFTSPGELAVALGNGDGSFRTPSIVSLPNEIFGGLAAGDMNRDGIPDLAVSLNRLGSNQIAVLPGKGDGTFGSPILVPTTTSSPELTLVDLNGDGKLDIVAADCCGLSEATYIPGNGDGTFRAEIQVPSGPNPLAIAVADFDGDKKLDLAIAGQNQNSSAALSSGTLTVISGAFARSPVLAATVISAADPRQTTLAPASLATAFGTDLASGTPGAASLPLPLSFGGTSLSITDSAGSTNQTPLLYVSPGQVNFEVPDQVASGPAQLTVTSGDGTLSSATVQIAPVAPAMFELNTSGLAAAQVQLISGSTQTYEDVYSVAGGQIVSQPVNIGSSSDQAYLVIYGTGLRAAGTSGISVTLNGASVPVLYGGTQGGFAGLDQINVLLPPSLAGKGLVTIAVKANGIAANPVNITVK